MRRPGLGGALSVSRGQLERFGGGLLSPHKGAEIAASHRALREAGLLTSCPLLLQPGGGKEAQDQEGAGPNGQMVAELPATSDPLTLVSPDPDLETPRGEISVCVGCWGPRTQGSLMLGPFRLARRRPLGSCVVESCP